MMRHRKRSKGTIARQIEKGHIKFFYSTLGSALFMLLMLQSIFLLTRDQMKIERYAAEKMILLEVLPLEEIASEKGSVEIVTDALEVRHLVGEGLIREEKLTNRGWGTYLSRFGQAQVSASTYEVSFAYDENRHYWLIISFPSAIEIQLSMSTNLKAPGAAREVCKLIVIGLCYLGMIGLLCYLLAQRSARHFTEPLRKLMDYTNCLEKGLYEVRLDEELVGEFGQLQQKFNALAQGLEQKTKENEAIKKARSEMILGLSHDLKNPLTAIMGYAEELEQNKLLSGARKKDYLRAIEVNGERANNILESLNQFALVESKDYKLQKEEVDFCEFIRLCVLESLEEVALAGLEYECHIPDEAYMSRIDVSQMRRVWDNLLGNAMKYAKGTGKLIVSIKKEPSTIVFEMIDQGIGMSEEEARRVFEPFVRNDRARNSVTGGSGLGLSIVKKIVEAHGGDVSLKVAEGGGCHFTIQLPINC